MASRQQLDIDFVRARFPALSDWAFFENAGGTWVPHTVIDRVRAYMMESQVQPAGAYPASALATERIAQGQRAMAEMINADPAEVIIGPSTTINVYVLAQALRPWFKAGDELIVTDLDHEANIGAWRRLAEHGVVIREWQMDPESAELELAQLERLLTERTRLVCFTQCSNITGSINDVAAITRRVHDAGALVCVDAVAYAPHRAFDVKALDVDFYLFSAYKLYGPHLGVLYGKREHLLRAHAQNHFFIGEDQIPLKLIPGGVNHELSAALSGIRDYFIALHRHHFGNETAGLHRRVAQIFELIGAHEQALARRFVDFLAAKPKVRLIGRPTGDAARRAPTFSFVVQGREPGELPRRGLAHRVAFGSGNFYAPRALDALGLREVVRASMVHYNSLEDVERLIACLDEII